MANEVFPELAYVIDESGDSDNQVLVLYHDRNDLPVSIGETRSIGVYKLDHIESVKAELHVTNPANAAEGYAR